MRTKTLLLTAALAAVGTLGANAQVFSVNAVGYVNKTVPANGFAMISNPLIAPTNTIEALFAGQLPNGTQIFMWNTTTKSFDIDQFDTEFGWNTLGSRELRPGQGIFIKNPGATEIKITFVGEVPQGTGANSLKTPLVPGFQIVSSQVPQAGTPTELGYTAANGDQIYQWNVTGQRYDAASFDAEFGWSPEPKSLDVGDAFFLSKTAAGTWERSFTVNQ
jgi:hypothetical protein